MDKVINLFADRLVNYYVKNFYVSEDKKDVYLYSTKITIQSLFITISTLTIGLILGMFFENLLFFITFRLLRKYSGGIHSNQFTTCFFVSLTLNILFLFIINYLVGFANNYLILIFELLSFITIAVLSPVSNERKRLSKKEKVFYKFISIIICAAAVLVSISFFYYKSIISYTIGIAVFFDALLLFIHKFYIALKVYKE